jgi:urease accessory protein
MTMDLLRAIQHADSGFPSGGFAFSQGLEGFAGMGARPGGDDIGRFVRTLLVLRWRTADRIALVHAFRAAAAGDWAAVAMIDREVEASTPVEALRIGSRRNGAALLTAHVRLGTPRAADYRMMVQRGTAPGHLAVVQGLLWSAIGVSEPAAIAMSGYGLMSALATAAVRLGLIGAIEAQRMVAALLPLVADAAATPVADDERMSSYTPFAEIAAMRHARQATRLFFN